MQEINVLKGAYFILDNNKTIILVYKLCTLNELQNLFPNFYSKNQILLTHTYYLNFIVLKDNYIDFTDHPTPSTFKTIQNCIFENKSCNINNSFQKLQNLIPDFPQDPFLMWKDKLSNTLTNIKTNHSYYDYCNIS